jgi:predicted PhzF superfamily epimerase YddE/YHI9
LDSLGVIVTARGEREDFVSRFFAPKVGVPEDPVTGSAHSTLIPFWAERLGKSELFARQISKRGGELYCRHLGERVRIGGRAMTYYRGELEIKKSDPEP